MSNNTTHDDHNFTRLLVASERIGRLQSMIYMLSKSHREGDAATHALQIETAWKWMQENAQDTIEVMAAFDKRIAQQARA